MAIPSFAQDPAQRLSPSAKANCSFSDGKSVNVDYSSPRAKGRKIYGDLVPFGEVWRTGANDATTLVTSADVVVGGKTVPAGSYTIFTVPAADKWTLIVNKKTPGEFPPEIIDLLKKPQLASGDQILAIPTLVRRLPPPIKKIIGDLSDTERVLVGLDLVPKGPGGAKS